MHPPTLAELRGLLLVVGYQGLQGAAVPFGLSLMVGGPCRPHLLSPAGGVGPHTRLPEFLLLARVHLSLPSPALDHAVEFLLDHLAARYVQSAPFTSFAWRFRGVWCLGTLRSRSQADDRLLALSAAPTSRPCLREPGARPSGPPPALGGGRLLMFFLPLLRRPFAR